MLASGTHTMNNAHKLEMVQRREARFVTGDYHRTNSVTIMLQQLQWPTLQQRRAANVVIMMFCIVNNQVVIPTICLVAVAVLEGYSHRFLVPFARTKSYQF